MTDLHVIPVEIAPVISVSLRQDVAYHAPRWPYFRSGSETGVFLKVYEMDISQTGLEDNLARDAERRWHRLPPAPVAAYRPRTALGRRLLELRARIVATGMPLLDWDGVEREVRERRGDLGGDEV
jgi:hypothetical protein